MPAERPFVKHEAAPQGLAWQGDALPGVSYRAERLAAAKDKSVVRAALHFSKVVARLA